MVQSNFGAGYLFVTPPSGAPIIFGAIQDVTLDVSFDQKQLHGRQSVALEQARGKAKIDIKAAVGRIDANLFNSIFWGGALTTGEQLAALGEQVTVTGTSTTPANAIGTDLGVYDLTLGAWLEKTSGTLVTGQYKITTGDYNFAAADAGHVVKLYYTYASALTGKTATFTNPDMSCGPIFQVDLLSSFRGKQLTTHISAVQCFKLSMPMKQDDFLIPSLDMSAQDDGLGNVMWQSVTG